MQKFKIEDLENTLKGMEGIKNEGIIKKETPELVFAKKLDEAVVKDDNFRRELYAGIWVLTDNATYILKNYKGAEGEPVKIKWYHFLLKKELRQIIFDLITFVVNIIIKLR